ncbi:hypothetical protein BN3087_880016 [Sulfurovum sp. enrichment culture clone C5]|uniref:Uncharacterized protein n=1 Tax=Sulfurovum sp. enrichment culture clone C5 TaxID=497650 RepID=A0A0S4XRD8_9BACT|nr:hypothetical protein BN3087_880016 [Sulfurovum sp. enrichment culture clone C5]
MASFRNDSMSSNPYKINCLDYTIELIKYLFIFFIY